MKLFGLTMIVGGVMIVRWVGTAHQWWDKVATVASGNITPGASTQAYAPTSPAPASVLPLTQGNNGAGYIY